MSYISRIYLESWFSWLVKGMQKILNKRRKHTEGKHWKNEEKEKRRIKGKSNNNNKHLWFYLLSKKLCFAWKHSLKKSSLKRSNDISKLNIQKYTDYYIIEVYINRLSATMQIFITMDHLILMSEEYLLFKKRQNHVARNFFPTP